MNWQIVNQVLENDSNWSKNHSLLDVMIRTLRFLNQIYSFWKTKKKGSFSEEYFYKNQRSGPILKFQSSHHEMQ